MCLSFWHISASKGMAFAFPNKSRLLWSERAGGRPHQAGDEHRFRPTVPLLDPPEAVPDDDQVGEPLHRPVAPQQIVVEGFATVDHVEEGGLVDGPLPLLGVSRKEALCGALKPSADYQPPPPWESSPPLTVTRTSRQLCVSVGPRFYAPAPSPVLTSFSERTVTPRLVRMSLSTAESTGSNTQHSSAGI